MGGNVDDSVRRRRYPLNADGTLVVDVAHNYFQQNDNGSFPASRLRAQGAPTSTA